LDGESKKITIHIRFLTNGDIEKNTIHSIERVENLLEGKVFGKQKKERKRRELDVVV
jgi:hypothetical protein